MKLVFIIHIYTTITNKIQLYPQSINAANVIQMGKRFLRDWEKKDVELDVHGGTKVADSNVGECETGTAVASVEDISYSTKCSIIAKLR